MEHLIVDLHIQNHYRVLLQRQFVSLSRILSIVKYINKNEIIIMKVVKTQERQKRHYRPWSAESRQRQSESQKKRWAMLKADKRKLSQVKENLSEGTKKQWQNGQHARKLSEETKKKLSEAHKRTWQKRKKFGLSKFGKTPDVEETMEDVEN